MPATGQTSVDFINGDAAQVFEHVVNIGFSSNFIILTNKEQEPIALFNIGTVKSVNLPFNDRQVTSSGIVLPR